PENSEEGQALGEHVGTYLQILPDDSSVALIRDPKLVERARGVLKNLPFADLALEKIVTEAAQQEDDLTLSSLLRGTLPEYSSKAKVRAAFTKKAYSGKVGELLKSGMKDADAWVLGGTGNLATSGSDLEGTYFKAYITEWRTFLESINVAPVNG